VSHERSLKDLSGTETPFRLWRLAKGWTLADEAGLTGLSEPFLSRVEWGHRQLRPEEKVRVARALGAGVGELFPVELAVGDTP
jgi:transcriptional regulator with XRE-family HTH domain